MSGAKPIVTVELELEEALHLQSLMTFIAVSIKENDKDKNETPEAAAELMKFSMKLTTGILRAFMESET